MKTLLPGTLVFACLLAGSCRAVSPADGPGGRSLAYGASTDSSKPLAAPPPEATTAAVVRADSDAAAVSPAESGIDSVAVTLINPLASPRPSETIAVPLGELTKVAPGLNLKNAFVVDAGGAPVLSQLVDDNGDESPDEIVFQSDFRASETKTFKIRIGSRRPPARSDFKVYGRFVRERHDDFAWENEMVAHRVYGPELETYEKEPLTSSGVDTWAKRVPRLIVNDWYMTDNYHQDQGEGADFYSVGKSRGCGGLGVWAAGKLHVSRNFRTSRVLANGPIRLVFELGYAPWDAGSARVSEVKRVTLDAGTHFNRIESTFGGSSGSPAVGLGIAKHPGNVHQVDAKTGWMLTWEPLNGGQSGSLGCAIVLPPGASGQPQEVESDYLLVTAAPSKGPLVYYAGSAWDRAGQVTSLTAWADEATSLSRRLGAPVQVTLAAIAPK
jgi:hypothetical protein